MSVEIPVEIRNEIEKTLKEELKKALINNIMKEIQWLESRYSSITFKDNDTISVKTCLESVIVTLEYVKLLVEMVINTA